MSPEQYTDQPVYAVTQHFKEFTGTPVGATVYHKDSASHYRNDRTMGGLLIGETTRDPATGALTHTVNVGDEKRVVGDGYTMNDQSTWQHINEEFTTLNPEHPSNRSLAGQLDSDFIDGPPRMTSSTVEYRQPSGTSPQFSNMPIPRTGGHLQDSTARLSPSGVVNQLGSGRNSKG